MPDSTSHDSIQPGEGLLRFPFDRDSLMFAVPLAVIAATGAVWGAWWISVPSALLTAAVLAFFRDPRRPVPREPGLIVSPADGRLVAITENNDPAMGPAPGRRVTIFLSVLNCHINRAPCAAEVKSVRYQEGRFLNALDPASNDQNESNWVYLRALDGYDLTVRQIAGLIARRIVCRVKAGDKVVRGGRFGLIRFGSRTELFLPPDAEIAVEIGQKVTGGLTVIARMKQ